MKSFIPLAFLSSFVALTSAQIVQPSGPINTTAFIDTAYDNASTPINTVACVGNADFPTLGSLPSFPNIGGSFVLGEASPECGTCWQLVNQETSISIFFTVVDTASNGFTMSEQAMLALGGQAGVEAGAVPVVATETDRGFCGSS